MNDHRLLDQFEGPVHHCEAKAATKARRAIVR